MKKALQISLAGMLFTIEEDAYSVLDKYLTSLRTRFAHTAGKDEIIGDIESRIAEQFIESKKGVISISEVDSVIASMGSAEEFGEAEKDSDSSETSSTSTKTRKFYRDTDNAYIAGVCSGLAKFFSIDVLWIRILFVVFVLTTGFGILVYILLWILVPEAKTAAQKLEMEGSPVTVDTLSESIKEKVEEVKSRNGGSMNTFANNFAHGVSEAATRLGRLIMPIFRWFFGSIFGVISFFALLAISFFAPLIIFNPTYPYFIVPLTEFLSGPLLYATVISIYFAIAIPFITLFIFAIGSFRNKSFFTAKFGGGLFIIWFIALIAAGLSIFKATDNFQIYAMNNPTFEKSTRNIQLESIPIGIDVTDGIRVTYVQGDVESLSVTANPRVLDGFKATINNEGVLSLRADQPIRLCWFCDIGSIEATITLPRLDSVNARFGTRFNAESWNSSSTVALNFQNGSRADMNINAPEITGTMENAASVVLNSTTASSTFRLNNGSRLELTGTVVDLDIRADNGSHIKADSDLTVVNVIAIADNGSRIEIETPEKLTANARNGSSIRYEGNVEVIEKTSNGGNIKQIDNDE